MYLLWMIWLLGPLEPAGKLVIQYGGDFFPVMAMVPAEKEFLLVGKGGNHNFFHRFSFSGDFLNDFGARGQGPGEFESLGFPTWSPTQKAYYVFDLFHNHFKIFDPVGTYRAIQSLPPGLYLKHYGKLIDLGSQGFIAILDGFDNRWNMGRFDVNFQLHNLGFPMQDPRLSSVSEFIHDIDAVLAETANGRVLFCVENLFPVVEILDLELQSRKQFPIYPPKWEMANLDRLLHLTDADLRSQKFRDAYSEIMGIGVINSMLLVGYRISKETRYYYQCFDFEGKKVGDGWYSSLKFLATHRDRAYFINEDSDQMELVMWRTKP